jgi:Gpi18-like mannosyltransferase
MVTTSQELNKTRLEVFMFFILMVVLMPTRHHPVDFEIWTNWAVYIHQHGLLNVYNNPRVDYHPIYLYALYIFDKLQGTESNIIANINYIKLFPLVFDFLPIIALCCFRNAAISRKIPYMFLLLNAAYFMDSLVWGQIDSVHINLTFLALIFALEKPYWSAVLFAAALAAKLQAIIFFPVLFIAWIYSFRSIKEWLIAILLIIVTIIVLCMPFIASGHSDQLIRLVTTAVGRYPYVSISGFNMWFFLPINPNHTDDRNTFFLLSYKHTGLLLFFLSSGVILLTALLKTIAAKLSKNISRDELVKMLLLAAGVINVYFYYFNTEMHERYALPSVILFFFYGVYSGNYKPYILISICTFLAMDKCFPDYLPIVHYKIIYASRVISIWFTAMLLYGSYEFYRQYKPGAAYKELMQQIRHSANSTPRSML